MNDRITSDILSNSIIMEEFHKMMMSQEGKDKIHYMSIITEAVANPTAQANLLDKLFKDVQKVESIDFGKIPDSKGDLTKYKYYDQMYDCIELLNKLVEGGSPTPNIETMNKLHRILLDGRGDFTFGYRTENYIITTVYKLMVMNLYELINVCIVDATEFLRAKLSMKLNAPTAKQIRLVTSNAMQFIKMYESGQWSLLMKSFKSAGHTIVTEAENDHPISNRYELYNAAWNAAKGIPDTIKGFFESLTKPQRIIGIVIALFIIIRKAIKYFFNSTGFISSSIKNNAEILRNNISIENDKNSSSVEKQKKMLEKMDNAADVIDYKVLKTEQNAVKDINNSNKEDFSPAEIKTISGSDFEL